METENNDANMEQPVTDPDANKDQVVTDPGANTDITDQTVVDENQNENDNQPVPYERFKEVNDAKKVAEDAAKAAQEQTAYAQRMLELAEQNRINQTQVPVQQPAAKTTFEQAMADVGVDADDLTLNGEALVKVNNRKAVLDMQMYQRAQAGVANNQFIQTHPDFNTVVGSVDPTSGQIAAPSSELLIMLQDKPYLAGACTTAQGAYNTVMEQRQLAEFRKTADINKEHLKRAKVDTTTKPMGGSAAGGSGGVGDQSGQQLWTREQVLEVEAKLARGEKITT